MKKSGLFALLICVAAFIPALSQNKKLDKSLKKIDGYYATGNFLKALSGLKKFKSGAEKMGPQSNYMVEYYLREAKFNLAAGVLSSFDLSITNALNASANAFTEESKMYASTLLDAAELYNQYGNFRLSREYVDKSKKIMEKVGATDDVKARSTLLEAEALIGQGFYNKAIELIQSVEKYYAGRAVEKETTVEGDQIKSKRIPEEELFKRFNEYARLKTLMANAYGKKGRVSMGIDATPENPDGDILFTEIKNWQRGKSRFFGETSLADIEYRYLWGKMLVENGTPADLLPQDAQFDNTLNALKRKITPTNTLAHDLYLAYLDVLLKNDDRGRYQNLKLEYDKVIDKNYPKTSVHKINMRAVEFNAKLSRDKTKDLEAEALTVLATKSLDFLYDIAVAEKRFTNAEGYLNQIVEMKKELCGENTPEYHLARLNVANFYLDFTNKIDEAAKIYEESYFKFVSKEIDEQHISLIQILNHIALWYEITDKYSDAQKTLNRAREAARKKYSPDDILLGIELNHIASLQLKIGDYDAAGENITTALDIVRSKDSRKYFEQKPALINTLETQARLFAIKGLFDEASDNLKRTESLIDDSKTKISDNLSTDRELAGLLILLGRYSNADKLLDELIPDYERLYGVTSLRLIEPLVYKCRILLANGKYPEAEKIALRANDLALKAYGDNSTKTAPTQKLLSDVYYTFGDYDKAQANVTKAIASQEKQFGRNHIEVAKSISQLALIRFHKGDNKQQVEKLMLESRDIMEKKLGKDNPQYAEILKNVAILYISEKKYDIAFSSLTQAETIWRTKTGTKNNVNAASIYTLTGDVYYQLKNYKRAEDFYRQAIQLYKTFFSDKHPEYVKVLSKLAKVHYMRKEYKDSKKLIEEALNNYESFIKDFFPALSERQKQEYWKSIRGDFEFYNTLAFGNLEDFKDLTRKVYDYQLLTKALLLSSSK
jgi:hemerythrin